MGLDRTDLSMTGCATLALYCVWISAVAGNEETTSLLNITCDKNLHSGHLQRNSAT
jgi:hypothetical protein